MKRRGAQEALAALSDGDTQERLRDTLYHKMVEKVQEVLDGYDIDHPAFAAFARSVGNDLDAHIKLHKITL